LCKALMKLPGGGMSTMATIVAPPSRGSQLYKSHLLLKMNLDPEDEEPLHSEFSAFPVLLEANDPEQPEELTRLLQDKVEGCKLLRREVVA